MIARLTRIFLLGFTLIGAMALQLPAHAWLTAGSDDVGSSANTDYKQQLSVARAAYFKDLEGDHAADAQARKEFSHLSQERPSDPVVQAYMGSLELLEAGRTWAFWNKHTLAQQGLARMDRAVESAPDNLEARFIRGATNWRLPFFFHRRQQAESDFATIAPKAEAAAHQGILPSPLAASALDYYGQILADRNDRSGAKEAFEAALRINADCPAGRDAAKRLR